MFQKVACANGKGINKTSKVRPKSIPKSMKNRYKFHARKKNTKNIKKHTKSDQKRSWKMRKGLKNNMPPKDRKNKD